MRLFEFVQFLLEYKRDITQQKLGDKLVTAAIQDGNEDIDTILNTLEETDPTRNKQYVEWLCKQYIAGQFRLEDYRRINDVLVKFENVKRRMQERDINKYTFHSLETEIDKIYNVKLNIKSPNQEDQIPGVKVLYNGPLGTLSIPETQDAAKILGKGTKWCTAADTNNLFNKYNKDGPLYVWKDKNGEKYQIHFESDQVMDDKDHRVSDELLSYFRNDHPVLSKLFDENAKAVAADPDKAFKHAKDTIKGRFPQGEKAIASRPYDLSYWYAKDIIKGRFPAAERAIAKDPPSAYRYARDIIHGRFPEGEKSIASNPESAYKYAKDIIKGRFPEGESMLKRDPKWWALYKTEFKMI